MVTLTDLTLRPPRRNGHEVAPLSAACLSPSNEPFLGELAEVSWQSIPYRSYTAGSLA